MRFPQIVTGGVLLCLFFALPNNLFAQQTVGLFVNDGSGGGGYTLFSVVQSDYTVLIDEFGRAVHTWENLDPTASLGGAPYLLEDGSLQRYALGQNRIIRYDWDGTVTWDYELVDPFYNLHHDIHPMPNGNVLMLVREFRSLAQCAAAGKDTLGIPDTDVWTEAVLEIEQTGPTTGNVVWSWTVFDHLIQDFDNTKLNYGVVEDHPELVDFNYGPKARDWIHANSVVYNPQFDQIMISLRSTSELWVIDHSTTTAEAATHSGGTYGRGGDLLYRWGNPVAYRGGDSTTITLNGQHDTHWIEPGLPGEGNILSFNNGREWGYSSGVESISPADAGGAFTLPSPGTAFLPAAPLWIYTDDPASSYYALTRSSLQRLANGNTVLTHGPMGEMREVTPAGDIVWRYSCPLTSLNGQTVQGETPGNTTLFKSYRYAADYPGLADKTLIGDSLLELNPVSIRLAQTAPFTPTAEDTLFAVTAVITADVGLTSATLMIDTGSGYFSLPMLDDGNNLDGAAADNLFGAIVGPVGFGTTVRYYIETTDDTAAVIYNPSNPPDIAYRFTVDYLCGNIDGQGSSSSPTDISDLTYLVDYLFGGGPPPPSPYAANVDGSSTGGNPTDISDLTYLVDFLFAGGAPPVCN